MNVGDVCRRDVIIAKPDTPLVAAVALMKTYHVGDLVVVDGQRQPAGQRIPVGILTDRDIALAVASHAARLEYLRVRDLMKRNLVTAMESESLHAALKRMQSAGIRRLPVVDAQGVLKGIVTLDDVIGLLSEELADLAKLVIREQKKERRERREA
jgi:CBS domain-containing protein